MALHRTTIVLPLRLKRAVTEVARQRGISLGALVRGALERELSGEPGGFPGGPDPLLDDHAVFRGRVPRNLSRDHDLFLYGE